MIILIIVCILIIAHIIYYIITDCSDFEEGVFGSFIGFLILAIVVGLSIIVFSVTCANIKVENCNYKLSETHSIVALKDNLGFQGNFYLCGGYIEDTLQYYYAEETENGIVVSKVPAESTHINNTKEQPKIEDYSVIGFKNKYHYIYAFPMPCFSHYNIYVPEGTVTTEYEINLE